MLRRSSAGATAARGCVACTPPGTISTGCPASSEPSMSVPVTTVPNPATANERSTGNRGRPTSRRCCVSSSAASIAAASSCTPSPVVAETACTGDPASVVVASSSSTSNCTSARMSASARSDFVMTASPRRTPSRSSIARCSRVCGITDSSAATISSARSIPPTPASMFLMKRSWPGTSTMLTSRPLGSVTHAKPRSMVMPRRFSSARRSGSMPVSACTSVDFPWSTWPAVPMTYMPRA